MFQIIPQEIQLLKVIPWFCTAHLLLRITRWRRKKEYVK